MQVYPHPELPLVPEILRPAFEGQVLILSGKKVAIDRLTNVEFCKKLTTQERSDLAGFASSIVQKICYGRVKRKPWMSNRVNIDNDCRLTDLKFTNRALVSLQGHELFRLSSNWRTASIEEIVGPKGNHQIGARLLLAFLLAAQFHVVTEGDGGEDSANDKLITLESELQRFVQNTIHSPRTAHIFLETHGWSGRGLQTLSVLSKEMSITHERARQIGVTAIAAMSRVVAQPGELPILRNALEIFLEIEPCLLSVASEKLVDCGFTNGYFDAAEVISAAERFQVPISLKVTSLDGQLFLIRQTESFHLASLRQMARKSLRTSGILRMSDLDQKCREHFERTRSKLSKQQEAKIKLMALNSTPGWSFLDAEQEWATITLGTDGEELQPRGPVARIARLAAYFGGVKLSLAQEVLNLHGVNWPSKILLALCLRIGLNVSPLRNDWKIEANGHLLSQLNESLMATTEFKMGEILKAQGGVMSRANFIHNCERQGVHRSTVLACLKAASIFMETTGGTYSLSELRT